MIETADAIKNLDDILDVEGLDGAFIGQKMKILLLICIIKKVLTVDLLKLLKLSSFTFTSFHFLLM